MDQEDIGYGNGDGVCMAWIWLPVGLTERLLMSFIASCSCCIAIVLSYYSICIGLLRITYSLVYWSLYQ